MIRFYLKSGEFFLTLARAREVAENAGRRTLCEHWL
jgi:hypothetical protein